MQASSGTQQSTSRATRHAVWYDNKRVTFAPELSWRHPKYVEGLPQFNKYMSRLNLLLQNHGRHVADIAVLYPIATMQAGHYLDGKLGHYRGGVAIPEADYVNVGELLATEVGRDYTFIHPEVLDSKCSVDGPVLRLNNKINREQYRVMIVPGHKTVRWSNLKKIKRFYDQGGKVIATGTLPSKSAEFGHDEDVVTTIEELFPNADAASTDDRESRRITGASIAEFSVTLEDGELPDIGRNKQGGMAVLLKKPTARTLRRALDTMLDVYDVEFEAGKELRYIHKVNDEKDIYFFANLGRTQISTWVRLRGTLLPESWNPHDGDISRSQFTHQRRGSDDITRVKIELAPVESLFIIAP